MTDAITTALNDLDTSVGAISGELSTLVEQVKLLQQQLAAGNITDAATLAAEIEQRATTLQTATAAAQSALSAAGSPTAGGTTNAPPSAVTGTTTTADTGTATPAATPADLGAPGSSMG
jgi:hypothetical protein